MGGAWCAAPVRRVVVAVGESLAEGIGQSAISNQGGAATDEHERIPGARKGERRGRFAARVTMQCNARWARAVLAGHAPGRLGTQCRKLMLRAMPDVVFHDRPGRCLDSASICWSSHRNRAMQTCAVRRPVNVVALLTAICRLVQVDACAAVTTPTAAVRRRSKMEDVGGFSRW